MGETIDIIQYCTKYRNMIKSQNPPTYFTVRSADRD